MLGETLDDWPWPHLLLWHMLDVAAVAAEWLQGSRALRRLLARQARCSEQVACAYVLFFIALHDIGKCEAGMQATAPEAVRYLLGDKEVVRARLTAQPSCGHGSAGLYLMEDDGFAFLTDPNAYAWLSAVCAHHGQLKLYPEGFSEQQSMRPAAQRERELDRAARAELVRGEGSAGARRQLRRQGPPTDPGRGRDRLWKDGGCHGPRLTHRGAR